jgi:hypothetical protein
MPFVDASFKLKYKYINFYEKNWSSNLWIGYLKLANLASMHEKKSKLIDRAI